jgi:hypothetical protein
MSDALLSLCRDHRHRPVGINVNLNDAGRDPTKTFAIRAKMRAEGERRWQQLGRSVREAIIKQDLLRQLPHTDKTEGFSLWLRRELDRDVLGYDGGWLRSYIKQAAAIAQKHAHQYAPNGQHDPLRAASMETLAISELRGITAAAQQAITRSVTESMLAGRSPTRTANAVSAVVRRMRVRTEAMAEYAVAKTHAVTTLSAFRNAGVSNVGIIPERVRRRPTNDGDGTRGPGEALDARRGGGPGSRSSREETPSAAVIRAAERLEAEMQERFAGGVEVLTAGDEDVCFPRHVLVTTEAGERRIRDVRIGDRVLTRLGWRPVLAVTCRKWFGELIRIDTVSFAETDVGITVAKPFFVMRSTQAAGFVGKPIAALNYALRMRFAPTSPVRRAQFPELLIVPRTIALGFGGLFATLYRAWRLCFYRNTHSHSVLECTPNHPIWRERDGFVRADRIQVGDLLQARGGKIVQVSGIHNVTLGEADSCPTKLTKFLIAVREAALRMPIVAIDLNSDIAADGKIHDIAANLRLLNECYSKTAQTLSHQAFRSRFPAISPIAGGGTKSSFFKVNWRYAEQFIALSTRSKILRATAFFRAVWMLGPLASLLDLTKGFAASLAFNTAALNMLLFAIPRAKVIAVSDCTIGDLKQQAAADADFFNDISSACLITSTRAKAPTRSPIKPIWGGYVSALLARVLWVFSPTALGHDGVLVYNLTVADAPEFFANKILVHNCQVCEDISAAGPYSLDEAEGLIPAHVFCRCSFIPLADERFAEVEHGDALDFDPDEPRDPQGRWTEGGSGGAVGSSSAEEFVSPNIGHLDFDGAVKALEGKRHTLYKYAAHAVDVAIEINPQTSERDVVGAWSDGAENSTMTVTPRVDHETLRLNAAMKGYLAAQKSVLIFDDDPAGKHSLYQFQLPGDLSKAHQQLLDAGVSFHTLLPHDGKSDVVVVDLDGSARSGIEKLGINAKVTHGTAEFIGTTKEDGTDDEQRADARKQYQDLIDHSRSAARGVWPQLRDRWDARLAKVTDARLGDYSPDEPRDPHGRWTEGGSGEEDVDERYARLGGGTSGGLGFGDHRDERSGVSLYAGSGNSSTANEALRKGEPLEGDIKTMVDDLTNEINAAPRLSENVTVYRTGRMPAEVAAQMIPGATFVDKGFVSTTLDPRVTKTHERLAKPYGVATQRLTIRLPKGTIATLVKDSTEKEIIVQRGSTFRVLKSGKRGIDLELVPR